MFALSRTAVSNSIAEKRNPLKKAKPSREKGIPITAPAYCMNWGHKRPSSNDRTVPDTAPTAKRMVVPLAQRLANRRYAVSPVARNLHSAMVIIRGNATPMTAKMMWKAKIFPFGNGPLQGCPYNLTSVLVILVPVAPGLTPRAKRLPIDNLSQWRDSYLTRMFD